MTTPEEAVATEKRFLHERSMEEMRLSSAKYEAAAEEARAERARQEAIEKQIEWRVYALWPVALTIMLCVCVVQVRSCQHDSYAVEAEQAKANAATQTAVTTCLDRTTTCASTVQCFNLQQQR